MTATVTKTHSAQPVGTYVPTNVDARKAAADFLLIQVGPNVIRWQDGRQERVSARQLTRLQATHSWHTDF